MTIILLVINVLVFFIGWSRGPAGWRTLLYYGGLSLDGTQWRACQRRFLFAVKALGAVFRGKYLAGLDRLRSQQRLTFAGESTALAEEDAWNSLRQQLYAKPWVVYAKPPWGSPEQVLKYLSRYTHRVAIANSRLVFVGAGVVRFRYTDYAAVTSLGSGQVFLTV